MANPSSSLSLSLSVLLIHHRRRQIVSMIKDVLRAMWKLESTLSEGIMQDIHMRLQMFLQDQVRDMIRHAIKKKKAKAKS